MLNKIAFSLIMFSMLVGTLFFAYSIEKFFGTCAMGTRIEVNTK